jgi:uncharacterized protein YabE (DUF348 family)
MKITRSQSTRILLGFVLLLSLGVLLAFRWKNVTLQVDGSPQNLVTRAITVAGALKDAGVPVSKADLVQPSPGSLLGNGMKILVRHTARITIIDGQASFSVTSTGITPREWLEAADLSLNGGDRLFVDGVELDPSRSIPYAPQHRVEIHRPVEITLTQDGQLRTFSTTALTVGEALGEAGVQLQPFDRLDPPAVTTLTSSLSITLLSSRPVIIQLDGKTLTARLSADTVSAALAQAGLSLQGLDYSLPDAEAPLPADGRIRVVRVREDILLETKPIPFETNFQAQGDMDLDTQMMIQVGQTGLTATRTRIRYEDGVETGRVVEDDQVLREPVSQVIGFGTRINVQSMSTPEGTVEYYRALDFYATSYYPRMASPPWYGAVACGGKWQPGYVAVDLNYIPCGTHLYVPGYGFAVAMDTAYISGAWIDLGYPDDGYVIWHRHVTVYFLTPVPPVVNWVIPPGTLN